MKKSLTKVLTIGMSLAMFACLSASAEAVTEAGSEEALPDISGKTIVGIYKMGTAEWFM